MSVEAVYALYRGDELIDVGTKKEIAERRNIKPSTVSYLTTPSYQKRLKPGSQALRAYRIDDKADDVVEAAILVKCPKWISELSFEEKEHIVNECRKRAERAWNDKLNSFEQVYLARKMNEKCGQMSVYDYV